eukprot:53912-Eustigmatos_ZCMA.PRE.1
MEDMDCAVCVVTRERRICCYGARAPAVRFKHPLRPEAAAQGGGLTSEGISLTHLIDLLLLHRYDRCSLARVLSGPATGRQAR